ncbi:MAG TPA: hypothetical protein PKV17_05720 [Aquabacterium sp.]|nr:hypothetical protein [Aquabacterium sp.]
MLNIVRDAVAQQEHRAHLAMERIRAARRPRRSIQRAKRLRRFPAWADRKALANFYHEARRLTLETGVTHEVDHVIPLVGDLVSGLHVETNLQVLPKDMNRKKSNTYVE